MSIFTFLFMLAMYEGGEKEVETNMENHKIKVTKTAHFSTIGKPGPNIKYCWIVCHGYGQLAKNFIRKFDQFDDGQTLVIAPEGLSRFYWGGFTGEVVASWMTKGDRLDEIADYANFLSTLYQEFIPQLSPDVKIILLGFSQGVATQFRWVMRAFPRFHHLILWAGLVPEDLDYRLHQAYFADKQLHFIYGTKDPFLTDKRLAFHQEVIQKNNLIISVETFNGEHKVDRKVLQDVFERIKGS